MLWRTNAFSNLRARSKTSARSIQAKATTIIKRRRIKTSRNLKRKRKRRVTRKHQTYRIKTSSKAHNKNIVDGVGTKSDIPKKNVQLKIALAATANMEGIHLVL